MSKFGSECQVNCNNERATLMTLTEGQCSMKWYTSDCTGTNHCITPGFNRNDTTDSSDTVLTVMCFSN